MTPWKPSVCKIDSVVDALEHLQDNACENSDTRADAGILLRNILAYNFLVLGPTAILEIRPAGHQLDSEKVARSKDELS